MKKSISWKALALGIIYGLFTRFLFSLEDNFYHQNPVLHTDGLMTLSFMLISPLVLGLWVAYHHNAITSGRKIAWIITPAFAVSGFVTFTVVAGWEGIICALMALPVFIIMSLIGGAIGVRIFRRNRSKLYMSAFALLPFIVAPVEHKLALAHQKVFTEHTYIDIDAPESIIWNNITRVRTISKSENSYSLFQFMGFPRPIKAELDTIAVGGIRKAIFDRGLFFTETVTIMQTNKVLAFDIKADPASTPPQALDEHVMVGGKYFDVLEGKYELQPINRHTIRLHLSSQFRLATPFNSYSGFWSKLIMRDIQKNILGIIKARSEQH